MDNRNLKKDVFSSSKGNNPQTARSDNANTVSFPPLREDRRTAPSKTGNLINTPSPQPEKKPIGNLTYVLIAVSTLCIIAIVILCTHISRLSNDKAGSTTTAHSDELQLQTSTDAFEDATTEDPTEATTLYPPDYPAYLIELNQKYDNYFDFLPDENGFVIPDSDTRLISTWELYTMTEHQVCLARNELYARHGYIFKSEKYSDFYSHFDWYVPITTVLPELVGTELANVKTILAYEDAQGWS